MVESGRGIDINYFRRERLEGVEACPSPTARAPALDQRGAPTSASHPAVAALCTAPG